MAEEFRSAVSGVSDALVILEKCIRRYEIIEYRIFTGLSSPINGQDAPLSIVDHLRLKSLDDFQFNSLLDAIDEIKYEYEHTTSKGRK